jgi:TonB-dependent starch-binding outer membrane protein SusC
LTTKSLLTVFLLAVLLQLRMDLCAQEPELKKTVTLQFKDAALETVIKAICDQTGYGNFYETKWLKKALPVTISVKEEPINKALDICFEKQPFTYAISGTTILIISRDLTDLNPPSGITITGRVMDKNGNPLEGANVIIRGTKRGITTNKQGDFELSDLDSDPTLEISYVGYATEIVTPKKGKKAEVYLEFMATYLNEVVMKGYSTSIRKFDLGSSTRIRGEDLAKQPVNNLLATIQSRVPGLLVTQKSGLPGTSYNTQIRGQRSIGVNPGLLPANSPLYVIDGVPFLSSSESLTQRVFIQANSPFSTINIEDIESIDILKDANATSIYGSQGANGVILITTKKPKAGRTSIDVNMYTGWEKVANTLKYMNTEQYVKMRKEAFERDGQSFNTMNAPDLAYGDTTRYINWKKELIGNTATLSNAHIRISGGTGNTQFSASTGYNTESTVFPGSFHKTLFSASLNVYHSPSKKLSLAFSTSYGYDRSKLLTRDLTQFTDLLPNAPWPYDDNGNLVFQEHGQHLLNPMAFLRQPHNFLQERLTASFKMNWDLFPWLQVNTRMGYTNLTGDEYTKIPMSSQDTSIPIKPHRIAYFGDSKSRSWIFEPQLEYSRDSGYIGRIKAIIGTSLRELTGSGTLQTGSRYTSDDAMGSISNAPVITSSDNYRQYRLNSVYGLFRYTYDNKYLLELNARRDGSSRFGPDRQFANFGSAAVGWIFSNENFIRNHARMISYGKLRATYGTSGNDQIGDYQFLDAWSFVLNPNTNTPTLKPVRLYNNDYRWELHKNLDIGLDLGLFNDRILLSTVWNQSTTGNQLIAYELPLQAGFPSILRNSPAVVRNRNVEFLLRTINTDNKHFKWTSSLNLSIQRNKLIKFPGIEASTYSQYYRIGQPLNVSILYNGDGVDRNTGLYRILNANGNVIPLPTQWPTDDDKIIAGTFNPDFFGGLQNTLRYKNWQLDFDFYFVKQKGLNQITARSDPAGFYGANQPVDYLNNWKKPGNNKPYQYFSQDFTSPAYYAAIFYSMSDETVTDASFIRLKNVSFSYNFPYDWIRKIGVNSINLYMHAQNLLTITSYKGNDPENGSINPLGLPPLRVITFGVQASF